MSKNPTAAPAGSPSGPPLQEKTFRSFTKEQGKNYAQYRRGYSTTVYQTIMDHHTSTGGKLGTMLDVGCGPGTAVSALAPHFTHAIGIDPSEGMINTARSLDSASSASEPIRFEVATAEDLGSSLSPPILDGTVDLITASTAAHWFDMSRFWPRAAAVLKPGGSVALWSSGPVHVHPDVPNAAAIQAALDELEAGFLDDYTEPGNRLARDLYVHLPLPWTLATPVPALEQATFFRKEWNTGAAADPATPFYAGEQSVDLDMMEKMMSTASHVTRWREAHPDAAGTERDAVRMTRRKIERLLHEAGVEEGKEILRGGAAGVLLIVKKSGQVAE